MYISKRNVLTALCAKYNKLFYDSGSSTKRICKLVGPTSSTIPPLTKPEGKRKKEIER